MTEISIHALLAESDALSQSSAKSTPEISIHALLAESDTDSLFFIDGRNDFYPRSPCGERRSHYRSSGPFKRFLSTLSLRRATR